MGPNEFAGSVSFSVLTAAGTAVAFAQTGGLGAPVGAGSLPAGSNATTRATYVQYDAATPSTLLWVTVDGGTTWTAIVVP
jgi:hypothetical protein